MKNKIPKLTSIASSAILATSLLFSNTNLSQAHNPCPGYRNYYSNHNHYRTYYPRNSTPAFQNPNPPYFSDYHQQDNLANQPTTYNRTNQDFPVLFPVITAAMLAVLFLLSKNSYKKTGKPL